MAHSFVLPQKTFIGKKALLDAESTIKKMGNKAFIVTGKHVGKSIMMKDLLESLEKSQIEYVIFDDITGEPTDAMVSLGVISFQKEHCDFIIGIGGGSPLDAAKAIAVMSRSDQAITSFNGQEIEGKFPAVAAVPTTAGTGSEATKFTVITAAKNGIKMLLKGEDLVPKLAIVDYTYTFSSPQSVRAATGLDALTHAIEAFTSRKAFALTDTLAISAIKRIFKYLPVVYKDENKNDEAYEQLSLAAYEAGICINNSSVTLVHGLSRPIGALFHVPHGISNAMILKNCLEFALDGTYERFGALGRAINAADRRDSDQLSSEKFIAATADLCQQCGITTLAEYGINREKFFQNIDKMSEDAINSGSPANTRKNITAADVRRIYMELWSEN